MSVGPPRWTWRSMSSTACWNSDARTMSASPNLDGAGVNAPAPLIRATQPATRQSPGALRCNQGSELKLTGLVGTPLWRSEDSFVHRKGAVMEQNRATIASLSHGITSTSDQPGPLLRSFVNLDSLPWRCTSGALSRPEFRVCQTIGIAEGAANRSALTQPQTETTPKP